MDALAEVDDPNYAEQTEFKFSELSDEAKDRARSKYNEDGLDYDWWDCTYEQFIATVACLGVTIQDQSMQFSGFCSQGDGASFKGSYAGDGESATARLTEHYERGPEDDQEEPFRTAAALDALTVEYELGYNRRWRADIQQDGRYSHSNTMSLSNVYLGGDRPWAAWGGEESVDLPDPEMDAAEQTILALMRALADWLYAQLEAQSDYLQSDESIDPLLEDSGPFDEDGDII